MKNYSEFVKWVEDNWESFDGLDDIDKMWSAYKLGAADENSKPPDQENL